MLNDPVSGHHLHYTPGGGGCNTHHFQPWPPFLCLQAEASRRALGFCAERSGFARGSREAGVCGAGVFPANDRGSNSRFGAAPEDKFRAFQRLGRPMITVLSVDG